MARCLLSRRAHGWLPSHGRRVRIASAVDSDGSAADCPGGGQRWQCRGLPQPQHRAAVQPRRGPLHLLRRRRVACQWRKTNWKKQKKISQEPSHVGQMDGMADGMAPPSCQTQPVQHSTAHGRRVQYGQDSSPDSTAHGRRVQHGQDSSPVCTALSPPHMHALQRQILAVLGGVIDESVCLVAYCVCVCVCLVCPSVCLSMLLRTVCLAVPRAKQV